MANWWPYPDLGFVGFDGQYFVGFADETSTVAACSYRAAAGLAGSGAVRKE